MKKILLYIITSLALSIVGAFFVNYYVPLSWFEHSNGHKFGTSITTIQGTDTLSSSRSVINTNFSNLNSGKFELSDWYATTSAQQIVTLGTITTGVWNGTAITASNGGTGSTTLSSNQLLLGNGTGIMKVVSGYGASGQLLQSNGSGNAPSWASASFDTTANYNFTGTNLFKNFSASSTQANPITLNTLTYYMPSVRSASSTCLMENGSGGLIFNTCDTQLFGGYNTTSAGASGATTTDMFITIPANTLKVSNALDGRIMWDYSAVGGGDVFCSVGFGNGSATTSMTYSNLNNSGMSQTFLIVATTTSAERISSVSYSGSNASNGFNIPTTRTGNFMSAYSTTGLLYLDFQCNGSGGSTGKVTGGYLKVTNN